MPDCAMMENEKRILEAATERINAILKKHPEGRVELRRKFWKFDDTEEERGIVPPLLIHADLIAVGDPRTMEAAEMIYDKYFV